MPIREPLQGALRHTDSRDVARQAADERLQQARPNDRARHGGLDEPRRPPATLRALRPAARGEERWHRLRAAARRLRRPAFGLYLEGLSGDEARDGRVAEVRRRHRRTGGSEDDPPRADHLGLRRRRGRPARRIRCWRQVRSAWQLPRRIGIETRRSRRVERAGCIRS